VLLLGWATGCSSGSHAAPQPSAADQLAGLAATAAKATYEATYDFHQATGNQTATVHVWRSPPALRVDVSVGAGDATTASLIVGTDATYSCSKTVKGASCLVVAKPGEPLPPPFNVAPTTLFSADLQQLASNISGYRVTTAPGVPATVNVPAGTCFAVTPVSTPATSSSTPSSPSSSSSPSSADVPAGTYCLSSTGLLVAAKYPSGNTIQLTSVVSPSPAPTQFSPYAKPTPLPTTTP